jgi:hypothetical protein
MRPPLPKVEIGLPARVQAGQVASHILLDAIDLSGRSITDHSGVDTRGMRRRIAPPMAGPTGGESGRP